ncbi:U2-associated snRNP A' protein [Phaffia rhodozyma]|uniref:U2 small nuclear ribonucleoprotein A' n=1 Tax=Phaffia rhodozyma TaxID=264483 RepID=A0A0F7SW45_PHARH|nr:U2-associated snRNP A' protein [Phaffia rhodozyma]
MVKLTPELVSRSPSHINPLKERELEFRGMAIQTIENLGAFQGGYDCLNMSDNALTTVANIPLSTRLQSIILANNSITSISLSLPVSVPNLTTLNLTGNSITSLSALVPLENCKSLRYLHLGGNPVKNEQYYREFCIWKVAAGQLHVLDYTRIKDQERTTAKELFLTPPPHSQPNSLATSLLTSSKAASSSASAPVTKSGPAGVQNGQKGRLMSEEDREKVKQAILKAESTEEVRSLERMLAEGHVPEGKDL